MKGKTFFLFYRLRGRSITVFRPILWKSCSTAFIARCQTKTTASSSKEKGPCTIFRQHCFLCFWGYQHDLHPLSLRSAISFRQKHSSHDIDSHACMSRLPKTFFWPGMNRHFSTNGKPSNHCAIGQPGDRFSLMLGGLLGTSLPVSFAGMRRVRQHLYAPIQRRLVHLHLITTTVAGLGLRARKS